MLRLGHKLENEFLNVFHLNNANFFHATVCISGHLKLGKAVASWLSTCFEYKFDKSLASSGRAEKSEILKSSYQSMYTILS